MTRAASSPTKKKSAPETGALQSLARSRGRFSRDGTPQLPSPAGAPTSGEFRLRESRASGARVLRVSTSRRPGTPRTSRSRGSPTCCSDGRLRTRGLLHGRPWPRLAASRHLKPPPQTQHRRSGIIFRAAEPRRSSTSLACSWRAHTLLAGRSPVKSCQGEITWGHSSVLA